LAFQAYLIATEAARALTRSLPDRVRDAWTLRSSPGGDDDDRRAETAPERIEENEHGA